MAAFSGLFVTGYKFWGRPNSASEGLDLYVLLCLCLLGVLQLSKRTRVAAWWLLPVMGATTFVVFDPSPNYGEFVYQIPLAAMMSGWALMLHRATRVRGS